LTWPAPPIATPAALESARLLCIRKLHEAERICSHHHLSLEMAASNPERLRARSVARIVRATLAALLQGDDAALGKLAHVAVRTLEHARAAQHEATGTWMITLPKETYAEHEVWFPLADVVPAKKRADGRPHYVRTLRNTVVWWIEQGLSTDDLAMHFLMLVQSPFFSIPMLRDEGVDPLAPGRLEEIQQAFAARLDNFRANLSSDDRAERLIIAGMQAIGMPKDKAESLFDFEKKREKRRGGTAR
jgi:hypothetical protein